MDMSSWMAVLATAVTVLLNVAGYLVAWGAVTNTVKTLTDRVAVLESEAGTVGELRVQIARLETRLDGLFEQFRDLNSAIRWMRSDAVPALEPGPLPGMIGPRRKGRT
jgi:hypothetical protein